MSATCRILAFNGSSLAKGKDSGLPRIGVDRMKDSLARLNAEVCISAGHLTCGASRSCEKR
jgi:hypothetical protein